MPCTWCHPLAVIPLCRRSTRWLNPAALVVGSLSPDFGYYLHQFALADVAHTAAGTLAVCLPSGLLMLGLFLLLRRPLCFLLPQPHRAAITPRLLPQPPLSVRSVAIAALSILVGAWTHVLWDSFTHEGAWAVEHIGLLRKPLFPQGDTTLPVSYVLQQVSTLGAGIALVFLYVRWLRRQPPRPAAVGPVVSDRWRYALVAVLALIALAGALPLGMRMAATFEGYLAVRVLVFRTGVYFVTIFGALMAVASIPFYLARPRDSEV